MSYSGVVNRIFCTWIVYLLVACGTTGPSPPDLILVTLDTTRWDYLSCYGVSPVHTPHLDAVAENGVLFTRAVTTVPVTLPAHTSILTGLYPPGHGVRNNGMYRLDETIPTMATLLDDAGYTCGAVMGAFVLDSQFGLDRGFELYDDHFSAGTAGKPSFSYSERDAGAVTDAAIEFIRNKDQGPLFLWLHYFDPHYPYDPPPPYKQMVLGDPYSGEVAYVDASLGRFFEEFDEIRGERPRITVIVGDHGEDLGDHGEMSHGVFLYDSTVHVPLIISCPGKLSRGVVYDKAVSIVDILPTVLELLNVDVSSLDMQGRSLLDAVEGGVTSDRLLYLETRVPLENMGWSPLEAVVDRDWKYIAAPHRELYNRRDDPGETDNLLDKESSIAGRLGVSLDSLRREITTASGVAGHAADSETLEKLASLGYIAGVGTRPGALRDPKDMLPVLAAQQTGMFAYERGDYEEAERGFSVALKLDPTNVTLLNQKALSYYNLGRYSEAVGSWRRALEISPGYLDIYLNLGKTFLETGQADSALAAFEAILEVNPVYVGALIGKGKSLRAKGEVVQAADAFDSAVNADPENAEARFWAGVIRKESGNPVAALEEVEQALALEPDMQEALREKALIFIRLDRVEDAVRILEEFTRSGPPSADRFLDLGYALEAQGNLDGALDSYRRAVALDSTSYQGFNNIGALLDRKGQHDQAERALRKAIELKADFPEAYYNLGFLLLDQGRRNEARPILSRFLELWGREDEAKEKVRKALRES